MKRQTLLLVTAAVGATLLAWLILGRPDDASRIRKTLRRLAEAVSVPAPEGPLDSVGRGRRAAALFTRDAVVRVSGSEIGALQGRESIAACAAQVCQAVQSVSVTFPDVRVTVTGGAATAEATAEATGRSRTGESFREVHELTFGFVRDEGEWRIARVDEVKAVQP